MKLRTIQTIVVLASAIIGGCSIFSRPDNRFYALDTIEGARVEVTGAPIGIDGVELPPGLDRRGIVARDENHRLEVRGTHQWASPLEEMVIHTLAFDLANRLPTGMVILPGQAKPTGPMRSIFVVVEELAPGPDPVFRLKARWTVAAGGESRTSEESIEIPLESLESDHVARGMSESLAELASRMAAGFS